MSETPSYVSQPQVIDLPKLLADVASGHIQVPRFQRPFVWEDERRVELLRSLRAGIPIGSLLVWRTSQSRLPSFDAIAGVKIPRPEKGQTISYLLDGHQRLTTLFSYYGVMAGWRHGDSYRVCAILRRGEPRSEVICVKRNMRLAPRQHESRVRKNRVLLAHCQQY